MCEWPEPCGYRWEGADLGPFELAEVREVVVESHDGTPLHGWLAFPALPEGIDRAPVALHSSPYVGMCVPEAGECPDDPGSWTEAPPEWPEHYWGVPPIELIRHGYVAAFFELRGTGGSGGCLDWGGTDEQEDQAVLVEWLANQPWSNGRVAMGGNSYPAATAWQAAVEAPEGLATIVTAGIISDWYTLAHSPQGLMYEKLAATATAKFEVTTTAWPPFAGEDATGNLVRDAKRAADCEPFPMTREPAMGGFVTDRDPDVWEPRRYIERFDQVRASVLMAHGLRDVTGHTFQDGLVWGALDDAHMWQISGQWGHGPPFHNPELALTPEWIDDNWRTMLFDWLGYWLQGVGDTPPERVDYQDDTGAWHTTGTWPPTEQRDEALYLDGDRLTAIPGDVDRSFRAATSPGNDHASATVFDVPVPAGAWGWCRQAGPAHATNDTAVAYTSEAFTTDSVLAGNPFAYLELSSDQPAGIVNVSLVRWPAGASCAELTDVGELVATGGADLRYHQGGYTARPFPLDTPTAVRVDLFNAAASFSPGDRLVVVVSGPEGAGFYSSTTPGAPEVTVHAAASHVVLPFVEGGLGGDGTDISYPAHPFDPNHEQARSPKVTAVERISGQSPLLEGCGDPSGAPIPDSEVEVHLAVNPTDPEHLLASWQQDRYGSGGGARSNVVAVSRDGGDTWTEPTTVAGISTCTGPDSPYDRATDPWGAIGPDGAAYLGTLAFNRSRAPDDDDAIQVSVSPDGGETWLPPATLEAGDHYLEKPVVTADPARAGRAYAVWALEEQDALTEERTDDQMRFAWTDDGGVTWTDPVTVPPDDPVEWEWPYEILALPQADGSTSLVVIYQTWHKTTRDTVGVGPFTYLSTRSDDLGDTWSDPAEIVTFVASAIRGDVEEVVGITAGAPSAALAPDDSIYVSWSEDTTVGTAPGGSDIRVARSDDQGGSWTAPATIASFRHAAFLPTVAVAGDGSVGVTWYDVRNDEVGDAEMTTDVWFASSGDRGASWHELHLSGPFDLRQGPRDGDGLRWFLGDYAGLVGFPHGFGALFPMAPPVAQHGPSDAFFARIALPDTGPGKVTGSGSVPGENENEATFDLAAHSDGEGNLKGHLVLDDKSADVRIEATSLGSLLMQGTADGPRCTIRGEARVTRDGSVDSEPFTVTCLDGGDGPTEDRLRVETESYSGGGSLTSGNVTLHD